MAIYIGSQKVAPHGIKAVYVGSVKVYEKSSYSTTLSDNTWDQIKLAIDDGIASSLGWLGQSKDGWQLVDLTAGRYNKYDGSGTTNAVFMNTGTTGTQYDAYRLYSKSDGSNNKYGYYNSYTANTDMPSYYNGLSSDIKNVISRCYVKCQNWYSSGTQTFDQAAYTFIPARVEVGAAGTSTTTNEGSLFNYFITGNTTEAKNLRAISQGWFLRSPDKGNNYAYYIKTDGSSGTTSSSNKFYYRPCFAI